MPLLLPLLCKKNKWAIKIIITKKGKIKCTKNNNWIVIQLIIYPPQIKYIIV